MTTPARVAIPASGRVQSGPREVDAVEELRGAARALRGASALGWTVLRVATNDWPRRGDSFPPSDG